MSEQKPTIIYTETDEAPARPRDLLIPADRERFY